MIHFILSQLFAFFTFLFLTGFEERDIPFFFVMKLLLWPLAWAPNMHQFGPCVLIRLFIITGTFFEIWLKFSGNIHPLYLHKSLFLIRYLLPSVPKQRLFSPSPKSDVASSARVSIKRDEREENLSWRAWEESWLILLDWIALVHN